MTWPSLRTTWEEFWTIPHGKWLSARQKLVGLSLWTSCFNLCYNFFIRFKSAIDVTSLIHSHLFAETIHYSCFGCVFRIIVLLECSISLKSQLLHRWLCKLSSQISQYICTFIFTSIMVRENSPTPCYCSLHIWRWVWCSTDHRLFRRYDKLALLTDGQKLYLHSSDILPELISCI